jgi:hypothetical protein
MGLDLVGIRSATIAREPSDTGYVSLALWFHQSDRNTGSVNTELLGLDPLHSHWHGRAGKGKGKGKGGLPDI